MVPFEGENLVVFYYISASEIWLNRGVAFGGSGLVRWGLSTVPYNHLEKQ
jgi:hypothetical protein